MRQQPTLLLANAEKAGRRNGTRRIRGVRETSQSSPVRDAAELYVNRELSLLEFQKRVLEEAQDDTVPLLERAKFLSIGGSKPG